MIFYLVLGAVTALLLRSLLKSWRRCYRTYYEYPGQAQHFGTLCSGLLLAVASLGWLFMGLTVLSAIFSSLNPSSPAPYIILPWFIGLVLMGIPLSIAEGILNWIRKDERLHM